MKRSNHHKGFGRQHNQPKSPLFGRRNGIELYDFRVGSNPSQPIWALEMTPPGKGGRWRLYVHIGERRHLLAASRDEQTLVTFAEQCHAEMISIRARSIFGGEV